MFFFELGVVVFWNMTEMEEKSIITEIKNFEINSHVQNTENDNLNYQGNLYHNLDNNQLEEEVMDPKTYISRDHLKLILIFILIVG